MAHELEGSGVRAVDPAGKCMRANLYKTLHAVRVRPRLVSAHAKAREILRAEGLKGIVGDLGRRVSVAGILDEFRGKVEPGSSPLR